jgi:hypothetical protein
MAFSKLNAFFDSCDHFTIWRLCMQVLTEMIMIFLLKVHTIEKCYFHYKQSLPSATSFALPSKTAKREKVVTENCGILAF